MRTKLCFYFLLLNTYLIGCKDSEEKVQPQNTKLDFEITGDSSIYKELIFTNKTGAPGNYTWKFGDGNSTQAVDSKHIYTKEGNYIVTLYQTQESKLDSITKPVKINLGLKNLSGSHNWAREKITYSGSNRIVEVMTDTTLQVNILSNNSFKILDLSFIYEPTNSQESDFIYFRTHNTLPSTTSNFQYYHTLNKVTFEDRRNAAIGMGTIISYTKK